MRPTGPAVPGRLVRPTPRAAWRRRLAASVGVPLAVSGCAFGAGQQRDSPVTVTEPDARSVLVAVVYRASAGPSLARLVAATARPGEYLDVVRAGASATVLAAASSPRPASVVVPGRPAAPGAGATSYQRARYRSSLTRWRGALAAARRSVLTRTRAALTAWARAQDIAGKVGRLAAPVAAPRSGRPARGPLGLPGECAIAASDLADLDEGAGASFGSRRVVLLYVPSLDGALPPGELTGDDVIVVTSFLASAGAASAAQAGLLGAGAARASILGPESTAAQLAELVTLGLSQRAAADIRSGSVRFGNGSARLPPSATALLAPLVPPLRETGAVAVINGYASTPGRVRANYLLSYARADAVARFFEAHGIPSSRLDIVGHGADDLVAAGPSAANRRVVVVVEEPAVRPRAGGR